MNEKYQIGSFGHARFPVTKKKFKGSIDCYGEIMDIDSKNVLFADNDSIMYLIAKTKFTFEPCEKIILQSREI